MEEGILLTLLRYDLNRIGERPDDAYLTTLLRAAANDLTRAGIKLPGPEATHDIEDYQILVVGTASWMYAKRRTGEAMPKYLRSLRNSILLSHKAGNDHA